jgi:hypothetical protein
MARRDIRAALPTPKPKRVAEPASGQRFKRKPNAFYRTAEWKRVRYLALQRDGGRCQLCGACAHDGVRMHVDHIKALALYPQLALDLNNMQTLCDSCNWGKRRDSDDWRPGSDERALSDEEEFLAERFASAMARD